MPSKVKANRFDSLRRESQAPDGAVASVFAIRFKDAARDLYFAGLHFRKISDPRQLECFALQGFHDKHNPKNDDSKTGEQSTQPHGKLSDERNECSHGSNNPQKSGENDRRERGADALEGMKTNEAVFVVGLNQQEGDRRQKKISESSNQSLG